ncbi:unnamed protein product [Polarella glacialis]|uniref:Methyltransferase FkbM domain-containing protein n=1 Tax=Polarella glacialis TaxID=89957 RepID=A0A813HVD2_POLGL|nr:unnamed protein product [Polarella glacialis]CAE8694854.1 unnamed protein product [Polarella glacialis]
MQCNFLFPRLCPGFSCPCALAAALRPSRCQVASCGAAPRTPVRRNLCKPVFSFAPLQSAPRSAPGTDTIELQAPRHMQSQASHSHASAKATDAVHRCGFVVRVAKYRSLFSDSLRSRRTLMCGIPILKALVDWHSAVVSTGMVLRYVEVGAATGDCMLAALHLMPEGQLQGFAFEAKPAAAALLRETAALNGLSGSGARRGARSNSSRVFVRSLALAEPGTRLIRGQLKNIGFQVKSEGGLFPASDGSDGSDDCSPGAVRASTLDHQFVSHSGNIHILSIFVNGAELSVLRGATGLLQAARIDCVVARVYEDVAKLESFLEGLGYETERREPWLLARPRTSLRMTCSHDASF